MDHRKRIILKFNAQAIRTLAKLSTHTELQIRQIFYAEGVKYQGVGFKILFTEKLIAYSQAKNITLWHSYLECKNGLVNKETKKPI